MTKRIIGPTCSVLGSVLYFVATGHPPYRAERAMGVLHRICHERHRPVWQVNPAVLDELSMAIDRLLEKRPSRRYSNAPAVAESLARILQQLQSRRPSLSTRLRSWGRRHQGIATVAATLMLAMCGGLMWYKFSSNGQLEKPRTSQATKSPTSTNENSPNASSGKSFDYQTNNSTTDPSRNGATSNAPTFRHRNG